MAINPFYTRFQVTDVKNLHTKSRTSKTCTENHGLKKPAQKKPKDGRQKKICTEKKLHGGKKNAARRKNNCTEREKKSPGDVVAGCWAAKCFLPNNYSVPRYQIALSLYLVYIYMNFFATKFGQLKTLRPCLM
jgi:hypothetical protein